MEEHLATDKYGWSFHQKNGRSSMYHNKHFKPCHSEPSKKLNQCFEISIYMHTN